MTPSLQPPHGLACSALQAMSALIGKGRLQSSVRTGMVLHERQAVLELVEEAGGDILLCGAGHDVRVTRDAIQKLVYQESAAKTGRILPRVSFLGADGRTIMALIGLDGEGEFRAALGPFRGGPCEPAPTDPRPSTPVSDNDAGLDGLRRELGQRVILGLQQRHAVSRWTGLLEEVRTGENFVNVIQPGFHLHLRGGAVAGWQEEGGRRMAMGADGQALGLYIERLAA